MGEKCKLLQNFCFLYILFWIISVTYLLAPPELNINRAITEYGFWLKFWSWSWYRVPTGKWDYDDYGGLADHVGTFDNYPKNDAAIRYNTYSRENFTLSKEDLRVPFIVKGFATDRLEKFDYDYIMKNFGDENYRFQIGHNDPDPENPTKPVDFLRKIVSLKAGMKEMKKTRDLYIRFSNMLALNNPEFDQALIDSITRIGPVFQELVGEIPNLNRFCFMGYGNKSKTNQHNAFTDNWFLQVSGQKRWVIVPPAYTPYMKVRFTNTVAMGSLLPIYNKTAMSIPSLEIITEPGDLMYFPGFWWHEVHNEGAFNFGCGLRPREAVFYMLKSILVPTVSAPGTMGIYIGLLPQLVEAIYQQMKKNTNLMDVFRKHVVVDEKNIQKWWGKAQGEDKEVDGTEKDKEDL